MVESEKPCLKQLIEVFDHYQSSVVGVHDVPKEDVSKYGIINPNADKNFGDSITAIESLVEKPAIENAPSNLAVMGRYILTPGIFDILATQKPGKDDEIQLTDAIETLNETEQVLAYNFTGERYDVGDKFGFIQATIDFALNREDLHDDVKTYMQEKLDDLAKNATK